MSCHYVTVDKIVKLSANIKSLQQGHGCFNQTKSGLQNSKSHIESSSRTRTRTTNFGKYLHMDREKKKMKADDDSDRISELPNSILCNILSLLPTKESAATSILSSRWKFLFAYVPDIDLECAGSTDNSFLDFFKLCNRMALFGTSWWLLAVGCFHLAGLTSCLT